MNSKLYALNLALGIAACCAGSSGARAESMVEAGRIVTDNTAYEILSKDLLKIPFAAGSSVITDVAQADLRNFVKTTKEEARMNRYLVAAWSDKEYPRKGELSSGDRKLAMTRAQQLKKALLAAGAAKVDTFEMTKQPNWIARVFSTEDAEIKNKGLSATKNERLLKEIGQRLRDNGGPNTAVIVARFANEVQAH